MKSARGSSHRYKWEPKKKFDKEERKTLVLPEKEGTLKNRLKTEKPEKARKAMTRGKKSGLRLRKG